MIIVNIQSQPEIKKAIEQVKKEFNFDIEKVIDSIINQIERTSAYVKELNILSKTKKNLVRIPHQGNIEVKLQALDTETTINVIFDYCNE